MECLTHPEAVWVPSSRATQYRSYCRICENARKNAYRRPASEEQNAARRERYRLQVLWQPVKEAYDDLMDVLGIDMEEPEEELA